MHSLLDLDRTQLGRIDAAISALTQRSVTEREKKMQLLLALEHEKNELLRCNPALRAAVRSKAA